MTVHRAGPLTTIQDRGRPGHAHLGVAPSGALDLPALELANRLAGNPPGTAGLECTLGGLEVSFDDSRVVAVTGAPAPLRVDGRPVALNASLWVRPRQHLVLGQPSIGARSYVAVAGGFAVPEVFGSRSTDLLSGLGPPHVVDGASVRLGEVRLGAPGIDDVAGGSFPSTLWLEVHRGPRTGWFVDGSFESLRTARYQVSATSNRIALRLDGPVLRRRIHDELASEGLVTGAIEVPPDGQPLIFLADHPTTGGYPAIGVIVQDDLPKLAQVRPGAEIRLLPRTGGLGNGLTRL